MRRVEVEDTDSEAGEEIADGGVEKSRESSVAGRNEIIKWNDWECRRGGVESPTRDCDFLANADV